MYNAFNDDSILDYKIIFPPTMGAQWGFQGIVTAFSTGAELEDGISFEATIKVSGKPSLGLTASTGLSALSITGTGGALSPAFGKDIYSYAFVGLTATAITVTATAANHELVLYIDGEKTQYLTSGSPSNSIPLPSGSKKLTILACESGKSQKIYEVIVVKG